MNLRFICVTLVSSFLLSSIAYGLPAASQSQLIGERGVAIPPITDLELGSGMSPYCEEGNESPAPQCRICDIKYSIRQSVCLKLQGHEELVNIEFFCEHRYGKGLSFMDCCRRYAAEAGIKDIDTVCLEQKKTKTSECQDKSCKDYLNALIEKFIGNMTGKDSEFVKNCADQDPSGKEGKRQIHIGIDSITESPCECPKCEVVPVPVPAHQEF